MNPLQQKSIAFKVVDSLGSAYKAKKIEFNGKKLKQSSEGVVEINVDEFEFGLSRKEVAVYGQYDQVQVHTLQVKKQDQIVFKDLEYQVDTAKSLKKDRLKNDLHFSSKLQSKLEFDDLHHLHLRVRAEFVQQKDKFPSQLYAKVTLKQKPDNLPVTAQAVHKGEGVYELVFTFSEVMEHVIGEYDLSLVAADSFAAGAAKWELGSVKIWFKEGTEGGSNLGFKPKFQKQEEIFYKHEE